ncbi:PREDICTED: squamosa promoter-binding-like protein 18 [Nelumbo nucifera]|uniref:Squamosa promoter-binding-like protein 18 n=1 Tax=Nelumbo nucifera TaxID=4432 RepID=A0A1U8Q0Y1_NELNU|nr:PREDICTED: squamosa promoter-binding-like protein 18 [Nelumbo nucifera]XP_010249064.1 PREDICTED: squamosa promoter-binding-like protein 18 [Nelumbo nucifera]XP_010249065.1 PREDICTED: squamosa promoter-binding-like protein 18 [Nelumbo nucifera]XP_010249066.1 PREDICTED: squamosa promoter-binding-like protein 18 [Nelumbo nucifera]XP_010249067.1 PREDICTED: squamosa promoter-binding-like protein 18 [Nelumbo nucifera]XP_010249068.1 PREDICTED: squamosa promoter-binding-like protein 18 [Nelumbo nuc
MRRRGECEEGERIKEEDKGKIFMDWDLKTPSWDLAELERESIPNIAPLVGSSSFQGQNTKGDCSVDLKLGRLGDFGDGSLDKLKDPRISTVLAPPSGSTKRSRAPSNGTQTVSCLVDGCKSDLTNCRDYHRRHKVCELHSKTPKVMVGGQEQRFCQQCSRFHLLVEFDEVKRSCRKRLDGHNRRRRKPHPESLSMNSGSLFTNHQGSRFLPFTTTQMFPTAVVSPPWSGVVKTEEDTTPYNRHQQLHFIDRQNTFTGSFSHSYRGKQFPFLQSNDVTLINRMPPESSVCQPLLNSIASSESEGSRKMFSDGLTRVLDSDCALSLLSSPPMQTSGISLNHVVQPDPIPIAQPLVPVLQYSGVGRYPCSQGVEDEQASVLVPDASDVDALHCHGVIHLGSESDGSTQNGGPQTLPFSWD